MANADTPRGLIPRRYLSGAPYNGAANKYHIPASDSTAAYIGSLVKLAGSADANGIATVTSNVSTGNAVIGVVVGMADSVRSDPVYRVASTSRYVLVADDPNLLFEIQEDSGGAAMAAANIGNTADLATITAGNATTGYSSMEIDSSTATASGDGTEDVLIVGLVPRVDNEFGTNAKFLVRLNNHFYVDGVAGA